MKKPIHEILVPIAFWHWMILLGVYLIWGLLIDPTHATYVWFIPNIIIFITELMFISISRTLDKRYKTLFTKYSEHSSK